MTLPLAFTYSDPESLYGGTWGNEVDGDVNVTVLSQEDTVHVGCNIDPAAVSDLPGFVDDLRVAFDEASAL